MATPAQLDPVTASEERFRGTVAERDRVLAIFKRMQEIEILEAALSVAEEWREQRGIRTMPILGPRSDPPVPDGANARLESRGIQALDALAQAMEEAGDL